MNVIGLKIKEKKIPQLGVGETGGPYIFFGKTSGNGLD